MSDVRRASWCIRTPVVAVPLIALVRVAGPPMPVLAAGGATLLLAPSSGPASTDTASTIVAVQGFGFPPDTAVDLRWDTTIGPDLGTATTDGNGLLATLIVVPVGAAAYPHPVLARSGGVTLATTFFAVTAPSTGPPSLQLAPTHGQVSQTIGVLGQNFPANATVALYLDSATAANQLASTAADANGQVSADVTLPAGTAAGAQQILAYANGRSEVAALYTVDAAPPPCTGFDIPVPVIGDICLDTGGLVTALFNATFGAIANLFGGTWDAVTGTFTPALTNTPNFAADPAWVAFQTFVITLQAMWGTVFVALFVFGMFARYMEAIGSGSFGPILGNLGRATILTAFLALYNPIMANWVFPAENGLASAIIAADIPGTTGGLDAIGKALSTIGSIVSVTSIIDLLILLLSLVIGVLCVVIRDMGLGVLAALYIVGPLALITWLSPQFDFIARWWLRTLINVLLWPVGYALALKVGSALLAASGWTGLLSSLGALGCLLLLYRVPGICGSMAGSDSVSGAVTSIVDRAGQIAMTTAIRALKRS